MLVGAVLLVLGATVLAGAVGVRSARAPVPRPGEEVPVTATNQLAQTSSNSPSIVADPSQPRFVVVANRIDARDFSCALQVSGDGGTTWLPANPVPTLPDGAEKCYAPEVAFGPGGRLYYLFVGLHGSGNKPMGAFLTTSTDRARTFSTPRRVLGPLNFSVRMAVDPTMGHEGRLHLVWLHAGSDPALGGFAPEPNPILAAHSDDGGKTFSQPVSVSDTSRARVVGPALVVGAHHAVHVAYYDLQGDARDYQGLEGPAWERRWSVVATTSTDAGGRFGPGAVVDDQVVAPERVMLIFTMPPPALVAHGRRLCAAWTDARHGDPDAVLRCSEDGGRRWEALRRLNDDPVGNGIRQYLPRLAVAPGGRIDAVFLDRRRNHDNGGNDTVYTFSLDGGRRFARNVRLTDYNSSARNGAQYANVSAAGQYEFGGRLGLLSRRSSVLAAWPDTRNSPRGPGQDVYATTVRLPTRGQPGWARALGAAGVGLGAIALGFGVVARRRHRPQVAAPEAAAKDVSRTRRRWWLVPGAVAGAVAVVALVGRAPVAGAPLPPRAQVVDVTMREFGFDYTAPTRPGRTVFRVHNIGREGHRFGVFPLPEDMPPIDAQLHGDRRRTINAVADVPQNRVTLAPGGRLTVAVDLVPGRRYAFLDLNDGPDGKNYALAGMNSEFRTPGGTAPPPMALQAPTTGDRSTTSTTSSQ